MEIIKEEKTIKCWNCGTNLKYTLKYTHEDFETTWLCNNPFVRCPICKSKMFNLDETKLYLEMKYILK